MRKRLLSGILICAMVLNGQGLVYAAQMPTTEQSVTEQAPLSYRGEDEIPVDSIEEQMPQALRADNEAEEETAYISPYITSVKNQENYGTCWAFANAAASEASMWEEGLAGSDVDLSEWQLAYYTAHNVTDPLGGTEGDQLQVGTETESYLDAGGNQQIATYRLANWLGPVAESTAPYTAVLNDSQATLPDSAAYASDVAHLENAYWISMKDRDIVKQMIKKYGAGASSYYTSNQYYNFNLEAYAEYCPDTTVRSNHAVTIVGWDDNYSKENFGNRTYSEQYQPQSDGAWYCKGSYGPGWSKDGYFWISYEDVPLSSMNIYFFDYGPTDQYDCNYQYDGGGWGAYFLDWTHEANVFSVQGKQVLQAVGFYTANALYDCQVQIYKNPEGKTPNSGELVAEVEASQTYAGYHMVELPQSVSLLDGETFSVVIKQNTANGTSVRIDVDSKYPKDDNTESWMKNVSSAQPGQSYIGNGSYWYDISNDNENCRIKAFTVCASTVRKVTLDKNAITLKEGETAALEATVTVWDGEEVPDVTWTSSDPAVAVVNAKGEVRAVGQGTATITCASGGCSATCEVTVRKIETTSEATTEATTEVATEPTTAATTEATTEVRTEVTTETTTEVATKPVTAVLLNQTRITMEAGKTAELRATIQPVDATNQAVSWSSSNSRVVTVNNGRLTAAGVGTATVTCETQDGRYRQSCVVTVIRTYARGRILADRQSCAYYRVTRGGATGATVEYMRPARYAAGISIPNTIVIDGVTYQVTSIGAYAFRYNRMLNRVVIGNNVTTIGQGAFYGCTRLRAVVIGQKVTSIGVGAFAFCSSLQGIVIPARVCMIGHRAFYGCGNMRAIVIQTGYLNAYRVGMYAFYGVPDGVRIRVPRNRVIYYDRLLRSRGIGKNARIFG